jgi:hypothetical protein
MLRGRHAATIRRLPYGDSCRISDELSVERHLALLSFLESLRRVQDSKYTSANDLYQAWERVLRNLARIEYR